MDKYIYDESNGLWYELQGDYYIPCLILPTEKEHKPIGLWGQRHKRYLQKHKREVYTTLLVNVRENPIIWKIPTHILYGEKDNLTAYGTIFEFAQRTNSTLSIMKNGEHWFHTDEQMKFLDEWIIKSFK